MGLIPSAHTVANGGQCVPTGVALLPLQAHSDRRGTFMELFREEWGVGPRPVQWNVVRSEANVLRGVHAHVTHLDYLTMLQGHMVLGLKDLRPSSATHGLSLLLRLEADDPYLAVIPIGVGHGFYFPAPAYHMYAVTRAFDGSNEYGCRWNDPDLGLAWPCDAPVVSARDRQAGSLAQLVAELAL